MIQYSTVRKKEQSNNNLLHNVDISSVMYASVLQKKKMRVTVHFHQVKNMHHSIVSIMCMTIIQSYGNTFILAGGQFFVFIHRYYKMMVFQFLKLHNFRTIL